MFSKKSNEILYYIYIAFGKMSIENHKILFKTIHCAYKKYIPEEKPLLASAMPDQAHQKTTLNPWVIYFDSKLGNSQLKTTFTSLFAQEFFKNDRFVNNFSRSQQ